MLRSRNNRIYLPPIRRAHIFLRSKQPSLKSWFLMLHQTETHFRRQWGGERWLEEKGRDRGADPVQAVVEEFITEALWGCERGREERGAACGCLNAGCWLWGPGRNHSSSDASVSFFDTDTGLAHNA
jgi:hypothetical protein